MVRRKLCSVPERQNHTPLSLNRDYVIQNNREKQNFELLVPE
jgi:hypothetical protein